MKLRIFELNPVFNHPSIVGPKQLCVLAHLGCTHEAGIPSSYYFCHQTMQCAIGQFEKYTKVIGKIFDAKPQKSNSILWITLHLSSWNCQGEE